MSLIKKIDVEKHFAERRAMRLGRTRPLSQPDTAGTRSAAKRKGVPAPAETLPLEPSSMSVSSASNPIAAGSGWNRLLRPPRSRQP